MALMHCGWCEGQLDASVSEHVGTVVQMPASRGPAPPAPPDPACPPAPPGPVMELDIVPAAPPDEPAAPAVPASGKTVLSLPPQPNESHAIAKKNVEAAPRRRAVQR